MVPAVTYSLVARDPRSGALGVAVQSHWFSVGSVVSWARAGVGAVATQSVAERAYGPRGLDLMAGGASARQALDALLGTDELRRVRQLGFVDAAGDAVAYTGSDCIPHAGHVVGEGFACQANMMGPETVPEAMASAFADATGALPDRMLAAMRAAEAEGGDVRGRQSAALLVVPAAGDPWQTSIDIRVEDHPDPVGELARLRRLAEAYELAGEADELLGAGDAASAGALYVRAHELAPESDELLFWAGLAVAHGGDVSGGADAVRRAAHSNPGLRVLLDRLSPEFAPAGAAVRDALNQ